jgi:hypothetical protein
MSRKLQIQRNCSTYDTLQVKKPGKKQQRHNHLHQPFGNSTVAATPHAPNLFVDF